ncbi:MAG TPA: cysteine synthase CysM [Longimicrobiales bacterium]|nr:cysteine synthase CysM [Longimicrobiales bacterium]
MRFHDLIGSTPLVELEAIPASEGVRPEVSLLAKLEGNGPGGSVKDRPAWNMIRGALERGEIAPGDRLVEATSGNTGIALAMAAGRFRLHMTLVVPESATVERVQAMAAYGAEVLRAPGIEEARIQARAMADEGTHRILDQFGNPDNWRMHYRTTGPEVWRDTGGRVTHFVSAMGTTGTIMGTSRYLKERNPSVAIVGTQPTEGSRIPGIRRWSPEMVPAIYEPDRVDRIVDVSEDQARAMTRRLAREEGLLAGTSSGGALHAALTVARELERGVVVFIVCDRGDRYLSSDLFDEPEGAGVGARPLAGCPD